MQVVNKYPEIRECLTIGIPVRIDSEERMTNLCTVVSYLAKLSCRIIVLEADVQRHIQDIMKCSGVVDYRFVEDANPVFHRTHYINMLLHMSFTELTAIWDADVLVDYHQVSEASSMIYGGATIVYPYDGRFIMLPEHISRKVHRMPDIAYLRNLGMKSFLGRKLCGGAYIVHTQRYLQCGGENERFTGWGPEDAERMHRVAILGHRVGYISEGELFHLYHPRGSNSTYQSAEDARMLREEFLRICCMSPEELKIYVGIMMSS